MKTSVKTVDFKTKGDAVLSNLVIEDVRTPAIGNALWGVEDMNWNILFFDPLWGFIHNRNGNRSGLATIERDHFYLPAGLGTLDEFFSGPDSVAATFLPSGALNWIYNYNAGLDTGYPDYTGKISRAMLTRWSKLTAEASSAGKVYDLMWTDMMANFVVGTKGVMASSSSADGV